jgi:hypothetical protein
MLYALVLLRHQLGAWFGRRDIGQVAVEYILVIGVVSIGIVLLWLVADLQGVWDLMVCKTKNAMGAGLVC